MRVLLIASPDSGPPDTGPADGLVLLHPPAQPPDWLTDIRARDGAPAVYLRVAPDAGDLHAALALRPDGIVLPGLQDGLAIGRLGVRLSVHEAEAGRTAGAVRILAGLGTARGVLRAGALPGRDPRLAGLVWEAEALVRELGIDLPAPGAPWPAPLLHARGLVVLAAAAAGVPAFDAPSPSGDRDAVRRAAEAARRDGFRGGFAQDAEAAAILAEVFSGA